MYLDMFLRHGKDIEEMAGYAVSGAQWLDEFVPGWHDRIDLEKLNLAEPSMCICGQLFVGGISKNVLDYFEVDLTEEDVMSDIEMHGDSGGFWIIETLADFDFTIENGFNLSANLEMGDYPENAWELLASFWIELIEDRKLGVNYTNEL